LTSVWADNKTLLVTYPSGNQNVTVAEHMHCSQSGSKAARNGAQKTAFSAGVLTDLPNLHETVENNDFTFIIIIKGNTTNNNFA
jgi:predicted HD phosphohydrolase